MLIARGVEKVWKNNFGSIGLITSQINSRDFHKTCNCQRFHEYDPKGEWRDEEGRKKRRREYLVGQGLQDLYGIKTGFRELREEIGKWKNEWHERLTDDSQMHIIHGDRDLIFEFKGQESLEDWLTIADSDHEQGYSKCKLTTSPTGKALFQGYINTTAPKDGRVKKAGYASMKSVRKMKSFYRESYYDWTAYSHLVMRVRGDGRSYIINLSTAGYYDITWNDIYHYVLFTRGGPYWQFVKIPFSKFVFASKGRVQDSQSRIPLYQIASVGLAAGKVDGPFCLEVDYIGVELDLTDREEHAYEQYEMQKNIVDV
jgi:NADH dehydrogenase [ubiquinone] 1 alpha subcomplex assembly factor 1